MRSDTEGKGELTIAADGAAAGDQLDEPVVHVGRQEADELVPGCRVVVAEQHVGELVHGDVRGVEGDGPGPVADVAGSAGADPQPAPPPGAEAERAQPDRAAPLALDPGRELAQAERDRYLQVPGDGGMPPLRARAEH